MVYSFINFTNLPTRKNRIEDGIKNGESHTLLLTGICALFYLKNQKFKNSEFPALSQK